MQIKELGVDSPPTSVDFGVKGLRQNYQNLMKTKMTLMHFWNVSRGSR